MAIVRFTPKGKTASGANVFEAKFFRTGGAEFPENATGRDMLKPQEGDPGLIPRGTDRDAPRKA
jgi:hypothetical protein